VFAFGAIGLAVALWTLSRVNVRAFQVEHGVEETNAEKVLAAAMD
jgi:hypothetical protein